MRIVTIDVLKHLALHAEKEERFEEALNLYRLALANAEETGRRAAIPPLQVRVGETLLRLGQPAAALPLFTRAGHAYARRGMGPEVATIGDRVLRAAPGGVRVFLAWAGTLLDHGHLATATAVLEVFVRRRPEANARLLRDAAAGMEEGPLRALAEGVVHAPVRSDRTTGGRASNAAQPPVAAPTGSVVGADPAVSDVPESRTGNTEPRVPMRVDRFTVPPRSPQLPLRPRPGTPGWRDAGPSRPSAVDEDEELDRLLVPKPFVRDTPMQGDDEPDMSVPPSPSSPTREPMFRRAPRRRWRPVVEVAFWLTAAAAAVFLLLKAGIL